MQPLSWMKVAWSPGGSAPSGASGHDPTPEKEGRQFTPRWGKWFHLYQSHLSPEKPRLFISSSKPNLNFWSNNKFDCLTCAFARRISKPFKNFEMGLESGKLRILSITTSSWSKEGRFGYFQQKHQWPRCTQYWAPLKTSRVWVLTKTNPFPAVFLSM